MTAYVMPFGGFPSQVIRMNGVVAQFHKQFRQYKKTKVVVDGAWSAACWPGR